MLENTQQLRMDFSIYVKVKHVDTMSAPAFKQINLDIQKSLIEEGISTVQRYIDRRPEDDELCIDYSCYMIAEAGLVKDDLGNYLEETLIDLGYDYQFYQVVEVTEK